MTAGGERRGQVRSAPSQSRSHGRWPSVAVYDRGLYEKSTSDIASKSRLNEEHWRKGRLP